MSTHKYRSPTGETIRVVTDTGHVALIDGEWRELQPLYHNAALAAGCECDAPSLVKNRVKPAASEDAVKDPTDEAKIERALKTMLEREEAEDFRTNGEPNLNVVAKLTGMRVTRKQVQPVFERLQEEADDNGPAAGGGG